MFLVKCGKILDPLCSMQSESGLANLLVAMCDIQTCSDIFWPLCCGNGSGVSCAQACGLSGFYIIHYHSHCMAQLC